LKLSEFSADSAIRIPKFEIVFSLELIEKEPITVH